ncbi:MAG: SOS response-associated peptidase [Burkholderiales bacterium]
MCGRYAIYGPVSRANRDAIEFLGEEVAFHPTFNAAPTQDLPVFRVAPERGRELTLLRWGLVPSWAKDPAIGARMINARAETVSEKPAFRAAFRRRRCLVPMSGFYEWQRTSGRKVPHFVRLRDAEIFAAAGLYEYWPGRDGAAAIESYTILTTSANELMRAVHDRMPVILHERDYEAWLDPANEKLEALSALLTPFPAERMRAFAVSPRVNNARNDGPELVEPA